MKNHVTEVEALLYENGKILSVIDRASGLQFEFADNTKDSVRAVHSLNGAGLIQWDEEHPWTAKLIPAEEDEFFIVDAKNRLKVKKGRWIQL